MADADYTDRLKDYVQVKDRVKALYDLFGQARIETTYELTSEPDAKPKVICRALVYRNPDDAHPSTGTSWLYLPGTTPYTKGSEIENAETSAVGRAIGFLGILIDKSLASLNEIAGKQGQSDEPTTVGSVKEDGSLIGIVEAGNTTDTAYEFLTAPDGTPQVGFVLVEGRKRQKVHATGDLAEDLMVAKADLLGQRATCWGHLRPETYTPPGSAKAITYYVLDLARLTSGALTLPSPVAESLPLGLVPGAEAELDLVAADIGNTASGHEHWDPKE